MPGFVPGSGTAFAVAQTQVGMAPETVKGTPVAPSLWIPTMQPKYKPDLMLLEDKTLQGSMVEVYDLVPGLRYDTHGWSGYPYLDTFPAFLRAQLGSSDNKTTAPANTSLASSATAGSSTISTTATIAVGSYIAIGSGGALESHITTAVSGTGPFTVTLASPLIYAQANAATVTGLTKHAFSLLNNAGSGNQPPAYTITDFDGEEWRQLAASQMDKLTIKGNATGLVEYECTWLANASITPSTPTAAFTTIEAPPTWTSQVIIGGSQLGYLLDWEFEFQRGTKPIPALTGTQGYYEYFAGPLQASGKMTFVETTGAPQISQYLNGLSESLDFTLFDVKGGNLLNIHSTLSKWKTAELTRSKEWVEASMTFQFLPSSTDALAGGVSPVVCTVGNAVTTSF